MCGSQMVPTLKVADPLEVRSLTRAFLWTEVKEMTTFSKPGYIKRALSLGVKGFILKESDSDYLIDAIHKVSAGDKVISPARSPIDHNMNVSPRSLASMIPCGVMSTFEVIPIAKS